MTVSKILLLLQITTVFLLSTSGHSQAFIPDRLDLAEVGDARINGIESKLHVFKPQPFQVLSEKLRNQHAGSHHVLQFKNLGVDIILIAPRPEGDAAIKAKEKLANNIYSISMIKLGGQELLLGSQTGLLLNAKTSSMEIHHPAIKNLKGVAEVAGAAEYRFATTYLSQQELLSKVSATDLAKSVYRMMLSAGYTANVDENAKDLTSQLFTKGKSIVYAHCTTLANGTTKLSFQEIISNGVSK